MKLMLLLAVRVRKGIMPRSFEIERKTRSLHSMQGVVTQDLGYDEILLQFEHHREQTAEEKRVVQVLLGTLRLLVNSI
jgi:hypothetical protein